MRARRWFRRYAVALRERVAKYIDPRTAGALGILILLPAITVLAMTLHSGHAHHLAARPTATAGRSPVVAALVSSPTELPTNTATATNTATSTRLPTATRAPSSTATFSATVPVPTNTRGPTGTPLPTGTPAPTATPVPTATVDPVYYAQDTLEGTGPGPAGPLSGLPTRPELANRRPVAVVIDNYAPDARPQTGLNRASLVFETLAEGGVTRLMAVYLERDAPTIGPVRSARIYFNAWADGLHAIFAHAGGNSDALYQLSHIHELVDADDLNLPVAPRYDDVPYWRSYDRIAPHNLYTNSGVLRTYAQQAGHPIYTSFSVALPHRVPDPYAHRAASSWIDVNFSGPNYAVHYSYDRSSNRYLRSAGGVPQVDPLSRRPIAPSNVVLLYTKLTPDVDPFAPDGVNVHTVGHGRAVYFRDGHLVMGRWRKRHVSAPLELLDAAGKPQPLNPGQTWIEAVPIGTNVNWLASR